MITVSERVTLPTCRPIAGLRSRTSVDDEVIRSRPRGRGEPFRDDVDNDAGVSTMTCVDGRRAEDVEVPVAGGCAGGKGGGGAAAAGGEATSPRLLKTVTSEQSQTYGA